MDVLTLLAACAGGYAARAFIVHFVAAAGAALKD